MNHTDGKGVNARGKSYRCPEGPWAWLNDIEISKGPYLASILLLIINLFLIRQPFFSIDVPYMDPIKYALHEVSELSVLSTGAIILGFVSVFCIFVPIVKFFEWKYRWFVPVAATGIIETIGMIILISKKNDLMENTLIGYAYELLSIEINLTVSAWMLIVVNAAVFVLSVKMLLDVKENERKY